MQHSTIIKDISVNIRQNPRARRIIIKIRHGEVNLVIPRRGSLKRAIKFFESRESWIKNRLAQQPAKIALKIGSSLPILDEDKQVIYGQLRGKSGISGHDIIINGDPALAGKKIKNLLTEHLKNFIAPIAAGKAAQLDVKYQKIVIRDNVTRWGSCSSKGTLSFSWRLVFAPRFVVEYLAAHEVAHLKEMNHGRNFWEIVANLDPGYELAEHWLKQNGNRLHLYQQ